VGCSADAHVFYGFVSDEEGPVAALWDSDSEDDDQYDWEVRHRTVTGFSEAYPAPEAEYPEERWSGGSRYLGTKLDSTEAEQTIIKQYHEYWDAQREWIKAKVPKCECGTYGASSADCITPYVHIKDAGFGGSWDSPTEIAISQLATNPEWDQEIRDFCELMGIEIGDRRIGWFMVCSYG